MLRVIALAAGLTLLAGCGYRLIGPSGTEASGVPIARATNGAQASFNLTTCAPNTERARLVEEIVLQLQAQGVIATADGPGTQSRVTLNLCGSGGFANPPARPLPAR
jgi:outer membrane lipopolysaccharide assembly protein LptE/RlpB